MTGPDRGSTASPRDNAVLARIRSLARRARKALAGKRGKQPAARRMPPWELRPFQRSDFGPLPEGWRVTGPHFIGVGTVKSGTSWWHSLLNQHPQVVANRLRAKELRYFTHFFYREPTDEDIQTYREAFAVPEGKVCGEWSPMYLRYPLAKEYIARHFPDARLLVLLRDPTDRMISGVNQRMIGRSREPFKLEGLAASIYLKETAIPQAFWSSHYAAPLGRLLELVDRSRILVLQYERCKARPLEEYARTCRFLGIDESFRPDDPERPVNRQPYQVPKLDEAQRRILSGQFREDMERLKALFPDEIDLDLWRSYRESR
jgi:hypothetical protein